MNPNETIEQAKTKSAAAISHFNAELAKIRTGRAHASILDGLMVEAYGSPMPLNQVANVSAPEAQLLQITPFDPNNIEAISAAIRENQSLGLNPSDDGRVIRVPIPQLTEERRRELSKQVGARLEDCMIGLRNVRHDALHAIDQAKKDKTIGEDEAKRLGGQVDEVIASAKTTAEASAKQKEQDILTV